MITYCCLSKFATLRFLKVFLLCFAGCLEIGFDPRPNVLGSEILEVLGMDIVSAYLENTVILRVVLELAGVARVPHFWHQGRQNLVTGGQKLHQDRCVEAEVKSHDQEPNA